jgi:hypothetical protein
MKALILSLLLVASALGQLPSDTAPAPHQVRLELLIVRLPQQRAMALQADLRDPSRAKRAQQVLLELVEKNEAELVDWPIVRTVSGNRAVAENVSEIRFPIEFAPPRVVENPVSPKIETVKTPTAPELAEIQAQSAKEKAAARPGTPALIAGIPSTFETRNAGVTFEVEPVVQDDGKTIAMQLAPQHVFLKGFRPATVEAPGKYRATVEQPEFHTQKVSANIVTKSGEPYLLSFKKLTDPKNTVEIFLLTATIESIEAPPANDPPAKPAEKAEVR